MCAVAGRTSSCRRCSPAKQPRPIATRRSRCSAVISAARASRRFGEVVPLEQTSTIVADTQGDISGALAWKPREDALQIVALATDPMWQRSGVGGYLVAEAEIVARRSGSTRVVLATTNDNLPALYFYQRRGYRITAVVRDAWRDHAELTIGVGFASIPVLDELRLEKVL